MQSLVQYSFWTHKARKIDRWKCIWKLQRDNHWEYKLLLSRGNLLCKSVQRLDESQARILLGWARLLSKMRGLDDFSTCSIFISHGNMSKQYSCTRRNPENTLLSPHPPSSCLEHSACWSFWRCWGVGSGNGSVRWELTTKLIDSRHSSRPSSAPFVRNSFASIGNIWNPAPTPAFHWQLSGFLWTLSQRVRSVDKVIAETHLYLGLSSSKHLHQRFL